MRKVLVIMDSLCFGGREKIVLDTCNSFNPDEYSIAIVTLCCDNNPLGTQLNPNITLHALPVLERDITGIRSAFFLFKGLPSLISYIKQYNPDIIHTHSSLHRLLFASIAISRSGSTARYYHSIHTSGLHYSNNSFTSRIKRATERLAFTFSKPRLVAVSPIIQQNNEKFYKRFFYENRCIPNGVNLNAFDRGKYSYSRSVLGLNVEDQIIVYPARLVDGKNHLTLLKAFKIIHAGNKRAKLILAGDGDIKEILENYIREGQLQEQVLLLGNINNVPEVLSIADIGAFPSEYEGFGIGLIEMMAMELPVVASDIQLFKTYIQEMNTGLLYPLFNETVLATKILYLMSDEKLRKTIGKNARERAEEFSLERSVKSLISYYES